MHMLKVGDWAVQHRRSNMVFCTGNSSYLLKVICFLWIMKFSLKCVKLNWLIKASYI